jgi:hypothetical protein
MNLAIKNVQLLVERQQVNLISIVVRQVKKETLILCGVMQISLVGRLMIPFLFQVVMHQLMLQNGTIKEVLQLLQLLQLLHL